MAALMHVLMLSTTELQIVYAAGVILAAILQHKYADEMEKAEKCRSAIQQ